MGKFSCFPAALFLLATDVSSMNNGDMIEMFDMSDGGSNWGSSLSVDPIIAERRHSECCSIKKGKRFAGIGLKWILGIVISLVLIVGLFLGIFLPRNISNTQPTVSGGKPFSAQPTASGGRPFSAQPTASGGRPFSAQPTASGVGASKTGPTVPGQGMSNTRSTASGVVSHKEFPVSYGDWSQFTGSDRCDSEGRSLWGNLRAGVAKVGKYLQSTVTGKVGVEQQMETFVSSKREKLPNYLKEYHLRASLVFWSSRDRRLQEEEWLLLHGWFEDDIKNHYGFAAKDVFSKFREIAPNRPEADANEWVCMVLKKIEVESLKELIDAWVRAGSKVLEEVYHKQIEEKRQKLVAANERLLNDAHKKNGVLGVSQLNSDIWPTIEKLTDNDQAKVKHFVAEVIWRELRDTYPKSVMPSIQELVEKMKVNKSKTDKAKDEMLRNLVEADRLFVDDTEKIMKQWKRTVIRIEGLIAQLAELKKQEKKMAELEKQEKKKKKKKKND